MADVSSVAQPESFAFDAESETEIATLVARYPAGKQASAVIPLLYVVQHQMKRQTGSAWVSMKSTSDAAIVRPAFSIISAMLLSYTWATQ